MFSQHAQRIWIERQITATVQQIDATANVEEKVEYTKMLSNWYLMLGSHHFEAFHQSFNFLNLTHAEVYFQSAIDALTTITQEPSPFLSCSLFAAQDQKKFYQTDASTSYIAAIKAYRAQPRVLAQMAQHQDNPATNHVFVEKKAKLARIAPPDGYVDPVPAPVEEEDMMEVSRGDGVAVTFGYLNL